MKITIYNESVADLQADVLVWPITSGLTFTADLKNAAGDLLDELVENGET